MIRADGIERAEKRLREINRAVPFPRGQLGVARVDDEAAHAVVQHWQKNVLAKFAPDMDPRHDSAVRTLLFHSFCVGVLAGREDQ